MIKQLNTWGFRLVYSAVFLDGSYSMRTVLKNCTLLDGTKDMLIQNDMDIAFENGKITEIGKVNAKKGDVC